MDEVVDPTITIKAIGHQRYWSAPFHENDGSATKCTRLNLWSAKLLAYQKKRKMSQNYSSFDVERPKGLEHARNGKLRLNL